VARPGRPWDLPGFTNESFAEHHVIDGVRYFHLQRPSSAGMQQSEYFAAAARALYETLCVFKPSAVLAASNWENAIPALIAARRLGVPFNYEVRGFWEITRASQESGYAETEAFRAAVQMETMVARAADCVFTLNRPMREELFRRGVEPERIVLMPNAHRGASVSALSAAAAKAKVGSKARHLVGYVGSFSAYEGLADLVAACANLRIEGLDIDLLLVGSSNSFGLDESPDRCAASATLREIADRYDYGDHLILTGRRAPSELPDLYAAVDIIVVPRSRVAVADLVPPVKPYEAAAFSRPLLLSDVGALRDMSERLPGSTYFKAGSVSDLCERLRAMLEDPGRSANLAAKNREAIDRATWVASTERLSALLAQGSVPAVFPEVRAKMQLTVSSQTLPRHVDLQLGAGETVTLANEAIWFDLPLTDEDFVQASIQVRYVGMRPDETRKALLLAQYLDAKGQELSGPYPGFTLSETVGWFKYLAPTERLVDHSVELMPCKGAASARIGLRAFQVRGEEKVLVSNRVELTWHDNGSRDDERERLSGRPLLPCLPFEMPEPLGRRKPRVASILDAFSHACFEPECDLIPVTPGGWRRELIGHQIDFVLVESAWHGNDDNWLYRVANFNKPPGDEIRDIIRWARKFGVPTVFWNKEDPPNFDRFIDRAADFDFIFTTDENCIDRYRKRVGPDRFVDALPFAAQPKIHNPILNQPRLDATNFAGTYYADDFEPRRRAMDMLLRCAAPYGLDIFDRMHGVSGKEKARFEFPADLRPFIQGSLAYREMLEAYRRYRVALNVNSVSDSPTMFSRRVFELLACGTPVVSTESMGIDRIFNGLVPTVETEHEAVECLERLMKDPGAWLRASVRGTRAVFTEHTYGHRLVTVSRAIGLSSTPLPGKRVVVIVRPVGDPARLAGLLARQQEAPSAIVVVGSLGADEAPKRWLDSLKVVGVQVATIPGPNLPSYLRHRHPDAVAVLLDGVRHYGPAYLLDARISLAGSDTAEASGISFAHAHHGDPARLTFDDARTIGMCVGDADAGSLALSTVNPWLESVLLAFLAGKVAPSLTIRARAPFDFLSDGRQVADVHTVELV
jgi:glycosyltransferase involved in cell wall biosynthesis